MATGYVTLPIPGGYAPDGSGTGNAAARPKRINSSGTQTTNSPKVSYFGLLFDPSTDQHWLWDFAIPGDWASGGSITLYYSNESTSTNTVIWKASSQLAFTTLASRPTAVFDTVITASSTPYNNTTNINAATLNLTNTSMIANSMLTIMIGRDADNASDTNTSDMLLQGATWFYTTT